MLGIREEGSLRGRSRELEPREFFFLKNVGVGNLVGRRVLEQDEICFLKLEKRLGEGGERMFNMGLAGGEGSSSRGDLWREFMKEIR